MPLRLRLALVVTAVASVLVLVGGIALELSLSSSMHATLEDFLHRSAVRFDRSLAEHRATLALTSPAEPVNDQSTVQVLSATGRVEYTTERAGRTALVTRIDRRRARHGAFFVERSRRAWHDPRLVLVEMLPRRPNLVLVVGASLDELANARSRLLQALAVGGPLVVTIVGAGSWLLAGVALRPVEHLRAEAAAISTSALGRRLAVPRTRDEIARLAHTLNDLLALLEGSLARQREFVAAASHELRTPLAVVRAEVELARRPGRSPTELAAALVALEPRITQLVRLSDDLLLLASGDEGALHLHSSPQELEPLVATALGSFAAPAAADDVSLLFDAQPGVVAAVDTFRFQQIVDNLVANALDHATGTPVVEVSLRASSAWATLEVADRGPGFPEEFLPHAFDRFSRAAIGGGTGTHAVPAGPKGRSRRLGVGLGLSVVRLLVEAHGGTVEARNRPGGGGGVVVALPLVAATAPAGTPGRVAGRPGPMLQGSAT